MLVSRRMLVSMRVLVLPALMPPVLVLPAGGGATAPPAVSPVVEPAFRWLLHAAIASTAARIANALICSFRVRVRSWPVRCTGRTSSTAGRRNSGTTAEGARH